VGDSTEGDNTPTSTQLVRGGGWSCLSVAEGVMGLGSKIVFGCGGGELVTTGLLVTVGSSAEVSSSSIPERAFKLP
jgi:hypothetical protein